MWGCLLYTNHPNRIPQLCVHDIPANIVTEAQLEAVFGINAGVKNVHFPPTPAGQTPVFAYIKFNTRADLKRGNDLINGTPSPYIIVTDIPRDTTENNLHWWFKACGEIEDIRITQDNEFRPNDDTRRGIVIFRREYDSRRIIEYLCGIGLGNVPFKIAGIVTNTTYQLPPWTVYQEAHKQQNLGLYRNTNVPTCGRFDEDQPAPAAPPAVAPAVPRAPAPAPAPVPGPVPAPVPAPALVPVPAPVPVPVPAPFPVPVPAPFPAPVPAPALVPVHNQQPQLGLYQLPPPGQVGQNQQQGIQQPPQLGLYQVPPHLHAGQLQPQGYQQLPQPQHVLLQPGPQQQHGFPLATAAYSATQFYNLPNYLSQPVVPQGPFTLLVRGLPYFFTDTDVWDIFQMYSYSGSLIEAKIQPCTDVLTTPHATVTYGLRNDAEQAIQNLHLKYLQISPTDSRQIIFTVERYNY